MGIDELSALLRANKIDFANDLPAARTAYTGLLRGAARPMDVQFESDTLGGIPGLRCKAPGADNSRLVLYLHGGAFCMGDADAYAAFASGIALAAGTDVFIVDYRLAPEHVFPAAIEDATSAYSAAIERTAAQRIALVGDSAGGFLAIAAMQALRNAGAPLPGAAVLMSPWVDLTCSGTSMRTHAALDPSLTQEALLAAAELFLGKPRLGSPDANLLTADLSGFPPTLVQVGAREILLDDSTHLAASLASAGVDVTLCAWPEMIHVWQVFHELLPEARAGIAEAGLFLRSRLTMEIS